MHWLLFTIVEVVDLCLLAEVKVTPTTLVHSPIRVPVRVHMVCSIRRGEHHTLHPHVCCSVHNVLCSLNSNRHKVLHACIIIALCIIYVPLELEYIYLSKKEA